MAGKIRLTDVRVGIVHPWSLSGEAIARVLEDARAKVVARERDLPSFIAHLVGGARVDLAILDLEARSAGLSAVGEVKDQFPRLPLLVLSSGLGAKPSLRWHQAGASGYIDRDSAGCRSMLNAVQVLAGGGEYFDQAEPAPEAVPQGQADRFALLSPRETEVLTYLATGAGNHAIAAALGISVRTVKAHVSSLYRKLEQENRTQLALSARQLRLMPPS